MKPENDTPPPSPMMAQYQSLRETLPADTLLAFRLGDFYELFFDDAKVAAPILNIALTKRNGIPMAGYPYHAAESYVSRLMQAGKSVAIAEMVGEPKPGLPAKREIVRTLTPPTP